MMATSDSALPIEAHELCWEPRGKRILGPIELTVRSGELLVIIGPNGAGKTTLLRLLGRLTRPTAGRIRWGSSKTLERDRLALARRLVYLPQLSPLSIPLTVREFVALGRYPHRDRWTLAPSSEDDALVAEAISQLELGPFESRPMTELSGGERQRASLAAALCQGGEAWLLDEPTTYLDPRHQIEIESLLADLHLKGRTLVVTTHDLGLAARLATRVLALADGHIVADGTPAEVLTREVLLRLFQVPFEVELQAGRPRLHPVRRATP